MTSQSTPQPITGPLLARAPGLQPRLAQWLMRPCSHTKEQWRCVAKVVRARGVYVCADETSQPYRWSATPQISAWNAALKDELEDVREGTWATHTLAPWIRTHSALVSLAWRNRPSKHSIDHPAPYKACTRGSDHPASFTTDNFDHRRRPLSFPKPLLCFFPLSFSYSLNTITSLPFKLRCCSHLLAESINRTRHAFWLSSSATRNWL